MQNKSNESNNIEITFWPQRILLTRLRLRVVGLVSIWTRTGRAAVYATYRSILVRPIDMSMTPAIATAILRGDAYSPYFRLISCRSPQKRKDSHLLTRAENKLQADLIKITTEGEGEWKGTATELVAALNLKLTARALSQKLAEIHPICVTKSRRKDERTIKLTLEPDSKPESPAGAGKSGLIPIFSAHAHDEILVPPGQKLFASKILLEVVDNLSGA